MLFERERLRRRHDYAVACVDTDGVDVLHCTYGDSGIVFIP